MISIVILSLWTIGNNIIIMLAGIQDIPRSYYESAEIDGAGSVRQVFSITLPLCTPTIYFNLIVTFISAFQIFQQPFILTNGGRLMQHIPFPCIFIITDFYMGKWDMPLCWAWDYLL